MIPILYAETETEFVNNGIGRLAEATECFVSEERDGIYECRFTYPVFGKYYDEIKLGRYITCIHDDDGDVQPFIIYSRSAPIGGLVEFDAWHLSYKLMNIILNPFESSSVAGVFSLINSKSINANPFTFWTDKQSLGNFKLKHPASVRSILGGSAGSILDVFGGGEYEFDKWTVKLHQNRGRDSGVTIRYGKNLKDLNQTVDIENKYDSIVPYWYNEDEDTLVVTDNRIVSAEGVTNPIPVAYDLSSEFDEAPTKAQLTSWSQSYLANNKPWEINENIKVDFVQLWQTDEYEDVANLQKVRLCDTVSVLYPELGVVADGIKVIKVEYDVLQERYSKMELGQAKSNFVDNIEAEYKEAIKATSKTMQSILEAEIARTTDMITAANGGHVVIKYDEDDKPQEILIMDDESELTATNIIRMNVNGIAFSTDGGHTYRTGWTIDGHFVADFITSGTMNANLIRAGVLSDIDGYNYWNLATGEFSLTSNKFLVNNQSIDEYIDDGAEGYVGAAMTQQNIFNKLTNNGETQGIYLQNGKVYINGSYISAGTIASKWLKLYGKMTVYQSETSTSVGGYIGYAYGSRDGQQTYGMMIKSPSENNYLIVTNGGVRMTSGAVDLYVVNSGAGCLGGLTITGDLEFATTQGSTAWNINNVKNINSGGTVTCKRLEVSNGTSGQIIATGMIKTGGQVWGVNSVTSDGDIWCDGSMWCNGTKSRLTHTSDYSDRLLYSYEMPSPIFGDLGSATIAEDGKAYVSIDPVFAETINTSNYQVFLQSYGTSPVYVAERKPAYFVVSGEAGTEFGWEIKAKQADYDQRRLEVKSLQHEIGVNPDFAYTPETTDFGELAAEHISDLREGRLSA